jgi:hypothetical protein
LVAFSSSHSIHDLTGEPRQTASQRDRGGVRRLVQRAWRVVDLQYRIMLTQAKLTAKRIVMFAILFGIASVLGLLAIIFLYIGVFKLLTDVAGLAPVWAYLIYGGFHLILAATLIMVGASKLSKKDTDEDDPDDVARENKHESVGTGGAS